jgi:subtilase family serine protease
VKKFNRITIGALVLLMLLALLSGAFYLNSGRNVAHATAPTIKAHGVQVQPQYLLAGKAGTQFSCQLSGASPRCYSPQQIRKAYNIQALLDKGDTGKGRTIVIIDAFQSPTIGSDLHTFDRLFGLNDPTLHIIVPDGLTTFNPSDANQVGWSGEITLDVEWSHAVAPYATIDLVLAKSNQDADLLSVTKFAVDHNLGDVISQSFGEGESCADPALLAQEHVVYQNATAKHMSIFASSGDQGAAQPTCDGTSYFLSASTPASDPLVTGVGGTYLNAAQNTGNYIGESAWNDQYGASGGGYSTIYPRPYYQNGVVTVNQRGVPDVAYNADVNSGVLTVWSESGQGANLVFIFGGTSAGSPQWAGLTTIADQIAGKRLGFLNAGIYRIGQSSFYSRAFHDIRVGTNTFSGGPTPVIGYDTKKGWDAVTGWGSPNAANLLPQLQNYVHSNDGNGL